MAEDSEGCLGGFIGLCFFIFILWDWVANSKLRYAFQYNVNMEQVSLEPEPKDCDFMHAPLGQKDCRYEKFVQVVKRSNDTKNSRPIISFDGGKTWNWDDGDPAPRGTNVNISWFKR
jgi:hypothetical protein